MIHYRIKSGRHYLKSPGEITVFHHEAKLFNNDQDAELMLLGLGEDWKIEKSNDFDRGYFMLDYNRSNEMLQGVVQ